MEMISFVVGYFVGAVVQVLWVWFVLGWRSSSWHHSEMLQKELGSLDRKQVPVVRL